MYCAKTKSQISKTWEPWMSKNIRFWEVFKWNRIRMFLDAWTALYKYNIHLCWGLSTAKRVALAQTPVHQHRVRVKISVRPSFRGCGEDNEPTCYIYYYYAIYYTFLMIIIKSRINIYCIDGGAASTTTMIVFIMFCTDCAL